MRKHYLTDFAKGIICGFIIALILSGFTAWIIHSRNKDRGLIEYAERQIEIEEMREDVINRPADEFLEVPDVRRAADGAAAEFDRKRDEALQRFRDRYSD